MATSTVFLPLVQFRYGRALTHVIVLVVELISYPSSLTMNILSMYCFEYPVRVCVELFYRLALNIPLIMLDLSSLTSPLIDCCRSCGNRIRLVHLEVTCFCS